MAEYALDPTMVRFGAAGLIPGVVQDVRTGSVLMVAWLNEAALRATLESGYAHFWSRSRRELWKKGETSGNTMRVEDLRLDCDADTLLISVTPSGPACHTGSRTCFDSDEEPAPAGFAELDHLWATITDRRHRRPPGSYTTTLLDGGPAATGRKVLEEAAEVVQSALANAAGTESDRRLSEEAADLLYHLMVLLAERDVSPAEVLDRLVERR